MSLNNKKKDVPLPQNPRKRSHIASARESVSFKLDFSVNSREQMPEKIITMKNQFYDKKFSKSGLGDHHTWQYIPIRAAGRSRFQMICDPETS